MKSSAIQASLLIATFLIANSAYAANEAFIKFGRSEHKGFFCTVKGADKEIVNFGTKNVDVQGFVCEGSERGKLTLSAAEVNQYFFKGQGNGVPIVEHFVSAVIRTPGATITCGDGAGPDRKEYKPGARYCPPLSSKNP